MKMLLLLLLLVLFVCSLKQVGATTTFVLIGATGNLAEKYLFQSLFNAFVKDSDIVVYAGARSIPTKGSAKVHEIIAKLKCDEDTEPSLCETMKFSFKDSVTYITLKTEDDYKHLGTRIRTSGVSDETSRIFYLSIPPFSYVETISWIHRLCRPKGNVPFRVAIEKPFGEDYNSAKLLLERIGNILKEEETFRIDHYLGKRGVEQIGEFKAANPQFFNAMFRNTAISRVDVVMTETEDCSGRTNFYNRYGIVRDVFQNHLTEVIALLAMEPRSGSQFDAKFRLAHEIEPARYGSTLLGQYAEYATHVAADHDGSVPANMPTFAATSLRINNDRWKGVPFIALAGKKLNEYAAYVRLHLRHSSSKVCTRHPCNPQWIDFHIQGLGERPCASFFGSFDNIKLPPNWHVQQNTTFGTKICPGKRGDKEPSAYTTIIDSLINGDRTYFVSSKFLLRQWQIWTPLLETYHNLSLRLYSKPSDVDVDVSDVGDISFVFPDAPKESTSVIHSEEL
eukprot:m.34212 g.34212  ORF g.34212 m.34212 type:complete len:508 (-) comp6504_c0_seq1:65-1588(-)